MGARQHLFRLTLSALAFLAFGGSYWLAAEEKPVAAPDAAVKETAEKTAAPPRIQLALLLDTSNSMDGLINQARTQLWEIVNEFAKAEKGGQQPNLEVALFEYGNDSLSAEGGHLRMVVPLTDDLDKVSEELFGLKTNGGQEYCGLVIKFATERLNWSSSDADLKCIFIAGNEAFTQGPQSPEKSCSAAITKGITVNTIFCGPFQEGVNTSWQKGATLADGSYMNIDQNEQVAAIQTPFDKDLIQLSAQVNKTYVFYGNEALRRNRRALQAAQDQKAAAAAPAAGASRAQFKASGLYENDKVDLVDAVAKDPKKLKEIKKEELPAELKDKSLKEQQAYLKAQADKRQKIQQQIKELSKKRDQYVAAERAKQGQGEAATLDRAIISVVREQATKREFRFKKE